MFRTLGPPAYFITLSADDMNWPDLMHVLAKHDGMNLTNEEVLQLLSSERRQLLCTYPVVVTQHFSHCFNSFINHVMKGEGQPIGEVVDFFWRVEFQQRGSPHIHSLWWVKDAPNLDTTEEKRRAPAFINRFITCHVPQPGEDNELRSLVLRLQKQPLCHVSQGRVETLPLRLPEEALRRHPSEAKRGHGQQSSLLPPQMRGGRRVHQPVQH